MHRVSDEMSNAREPDLYDICLIKSVQFLTAQVFFKFQSSKKRLPILFLPIFLPENKVSYLYIYFTHTIVDS